MCSATKGDGVWYLQVKYGSGHVVEIEPNKPSIECGKTFPRDLEKAVTAVRKAVAKVTSTSR